MGQVDLDFKPSVPVFDANVSIGRRHDKRVAVDTVDGALEEMQRAGIGRASSTPLTRPTGTLRRATR